MMDDVVLHLRHHPDPGERVPAARDLAAVARRAPPAAHRQRARGHRAAFSRPHREGRVRLRAAIVPNLVDEAPSAGEPTAAASELTLLDEQAKRLQALAAALGGGALLRLAGALPPLEQGS